ncbi:RelA/SpoT family protein [Paraliomyxa miuraensis]|uniref:RelA/SpoT family protein n=1 Tax=Paraliomyxa miuraensis TaxID=376150 RepID=UPI002252B2EA|nr:bifunctional (p)ppGpp synthetase/guanosine-3',5'-bis(diphosphate) 3'-pyrophosphohydrolase [Paraliomyxa miuraensis]MCX4241329.1 bifunctional (p)ppGpp synthetase/guanosine-3',5'-bis(diphosphate) 3'-pyrophosphohydrolase [Paraliomyxa miuraensis]
MADRQQLTVSDLHARLRERGDEERAAIEQALEDTEALHSPAALERALDVAMLLLDLRLDAATVVAGMLHGGVAATAEPGPLEERHGSEVRGLLEGVGRLDTIEWDHLEREASENLRKMFLAMASDVRVVLIALAGRVHDMRWLDDRTPKERHTLARETMDVFAPLANRLGIWQVKWELEDLAFRELEPQTYREVGKLLAEKRAARRAMIDEVMRVLEDELAKADIPADIMGRPKHIYSIYKKMRRKGLTIDEIYDVSAVRVLVEELGQCYAVLGLVHGLWSPIPGEFDDYIAKPKSNFYRSLHTAVVGPGGRNLEVQIRTREMHEQSEYGIAAHWRYKEGGKSASRRFDEKINWLRQLMEWQKEVTDPADLAESLKTDVFSEQVYVFTPTGEVLDLPQGATPIDFAYRIHTQVGHRCRGAKVDGQIVPLDHELHTGERVEIITAKNGKPSRDWLNPHLRYVKSTSARAKIRSYFREQARDTSIAQGREMVEREVKRLGMDATLDSVALLCGHEDTTDFLAKLGFGDLSIQGVAGKLLEAERERKKAESPPVPPKPARPPRDRVRGGVSVGGVDDVMSSPANCCHPVPGDDVLGYITRGRGVVIHRRDCPNVRNHPEPERLIELDWGHKLGDVYPVELQVVAQDRAGLLRDIADVVSREGVNMRSATTGGSGGRSSGGSSSDGAAVLHTTLDIRSTEQLLRVMSRLEQLPYVRSVRRLAG